ncbi:MAG: S-layer homology domain-containing protein [Clostridia bacterium]|nr:S-layer homology domain-containing protein [Clostridia bacterium]
MRKARILALVLCAAFLMSQVCISASGEGEPGKKVFVTSYDPDNYVKFTIEDQTLHVEGVLDYDDLKYVLVRIEQSTDTWVEARGGEHFSFDVSLATSPGFFPVQLMTSDGEQNGYGYMYFKRYIPKGVMIRETGHEFYFADSPVLENNLSWKDEWINLGDVTAFFPTYAGLVYSGQLRDENFDDYFRNLTSDPSYRMYESAVRSKSDEIVGDETDDYKKIYLLHRWVVENIYYDNDYINWLNGPMTDDYALMIDPMQVMRAGFGVCSGYASLLTALCRTQGIPCIMVMTYALGTSDSGDYFDGENSGAEDANHVYCEAYVNGRWVIMDPTWDSTPDRIRENGKFLKGKLGPPNYFDITDEMLAWSHKTIYRMDSDDEDTPHDWAKEEVWDAILAGIVPHTVQREYREPVSRGSFCRLLMQMMCTYYGKSSPRELLEMKETGYPGRMFVDVYDDDITAAAALGIVNGVGQGRFNPDGGITREQAATMMKRAADVMGFAYGNDIPSYSDGDLVSSWAADAVAAIGTLKTQAGTAVMGGTGQNMFSPKGNYTGEQAVLSVWRLYLCAVNHVVKYEKAPAGLL